MRPNKRDLTAQCGNAAQRKMPAPARPRRANTYRADTICASCCASRIDIVFEWAGRALAAYLSKPISKPSGGSADARMVADTLEPGDVLLVEGNTRMSAAIKYLTQSTWSHAALYIGL